MRTSQPLAARGAAAINTNIRQVRPSVSQILHINTLIFILLNLHWIHNIVQQLLFTSYRMSPAFERY